MQPIDKPDEALAEHDPAAPAAPRGQRLKPGERRVHILQTLASMLEAPKSEKSPRLRLRHGSACPKPRFIGTLPARRKCSKG